MVFPVVMYGCESRTINKAEHQRIDAFELWCWRRLLRVPWTARRSNQSILKEIGPGCSLQGLMLKLKLQYWPPDAKNWLIGKDPDAGKDWGQEEKGATEDEMVGWHHWLNGHEFEQAPGVGDGQESLACCSQWGRKVGHDWVTELTDLPKVTLLESSGPDLNPYPLDSKASVLYITWTPQFFVFIFTELPQVLFPWLTSRFIHWILKQLGCIDWC